MRRVRWPARCGGRRQVARLRRRAVAAGYRLVAARAADAQELADSQAFIQAQIDSYRAAGKPNAEQLALADFCQALLTLNEFVFVE